MNNTYFTNIHIYIYCVCVCVCVFFLLVNDYRCGIVLCARDAKFAVECDTCKMSYCLVCLASGTKDPCVRCGHRTSKRVEQLVHLRLKSIYKAFKQSGAALSNSGKGNNNNNNNSHSGDGSGRKHDSSDSGNGDHGRKSWRGEDSRHNPLDPNNRSKKSGNGSSSVSMPLPASVQRYAEMHGKDLKKRPSHVSGRQNLKGDVGAVLQVAAAAASATAAASSSDGMSRHGRGSHRDYFSDCPTKMNDPDFDDSDQSNNHRKNRESTDSDRFASRTQAEADAAAAALLAELDEEKMQNEASSKAKKSKKKKKKERQAAKGKEEEEMRLKEEGGEEDLKLKKEANSKESEQRKMVGEDEKAESPKKKGKRKKKKDQDLNQRNSSPLSVDKPSPQPTESIDNESEDDDIIRLAELSNKDISYSHDILNKDDIEKHLADLVSENDLEGIEKLLAELKGIPGHAAVRKNAKKAVKRIKEESMANETHSTTEHQDQYLNQSNHDVSTDIVDTGNEGNSVYKAPEPLLKIVSKNSRVAAPGQTARYECVMHMSPSVVGWVIGKGGQRIRDLMEESGAKVWIDQDSMGPNDMRVVYVSGNKKSIDIAVTMVKDLVAKAPVGGTTTYGTSAPISVQTVNDTSSVTSTRSSLTSTPVSLVQNFTQQAPPMAEKPSFSPAKKAAIPTVDHHNIAPKSPNVNPHIPVTGSSPITNSPTKPQVLPVPPPGILGVSDVHNMQNLSSPLKSNTNEQQNKPPGSARAVYELTCEPRFVPLLIGRRGWTVKQIQDMSGARVDIDQTVTPRRIIVSGEVDQVQQAVKMVRSVLSYPHAKQHYSSSGELDEGDTNDEDFFKEISSTPPYAFMGLNSEDRMASMEMNQSQPNNIRVDAYDFNQPPNNQSDNSLLHHHHQQLKMGPGMNMFSRASSIPSQVPPQMQMSQPPPTYQENNLTHSNARPDHLFIRRQQSMPLPSVSQSLQASPESHSFRNLPTPTDTFHYDTVLPLPQMKMPSQMSGMNPNQASHLPFAGLMESSHVGQGMPSYGFTTNQSTNTQNQHRVSTERDAVNSMFGNRIDDSLLNSFNNFSFGGQESESNLGSNFFDFLSHDVNEKPTEERSFGLGGVRLDLSNENNNNKNNNTSLDSDLSAPRYDYSQRGP